MAIVGYWRLNGNSNDASGNASNGTDANITYSQANGKLNQGAAFNGSSSKITIGNISILNLITYTCSSWFKTTNASNIPQYIIYKGVGTLEPVAVYTYQGRPTIENYKTGVYDKYSRTTNSYADGKWHHLVAIRNAGVGYFLYVDGFYVPQTGSGADTNTTDTSTANFLIGARNNNDYWFNGSLDEIIVDNTVWNPAKIKNEYSRMKGFF